MDNEPKKSTRAEREWQQRRTEILEAATHLFLGQGYAATTMQMIADHAEFSVGYLYKHFAGKTELTDAILAMQMEIMMGFRKEVRKRTELSPIEMLKEELTCICKHSAENAGLMALFSTLDTHCSKLGKPPREIREENIELFRRARDSGEIRDCDPTLVAAAYKGVIWSLLQSALDSGRAESFSEVPAVVSNLFLDPLCRFETETNGKVRTKK